MCGIAGFVDFNSTLDKHQLDRMTDALQKRGPDGRGVFFEKTPSCFLGLGHRRLSIIDLSEGGKQPQKKWDLQITFNGEIYNYIEIKTELSKLGYTFQSHSDTEVILAAYKEWGTRCVDKFIGMFAFAIFDQSNNLLRIFRDRAGVKPLYYYWKDNTFLFASELKSFHSLDRFDKTINKDIIPYYLQYGYIPSPHSIFKYCKKLLQGHYLEINLHSKKIDFIKYWDVDDFYNQKPIDLSDQEILEKADELLTSACQYRTVADVPVGVFLSGGYDSSLVTAILQANRSDKVNTFTIGFEDSKYNEADHAKKIASFLGTNHTEHYCSQKEAMDIIPDLADIYDEPFGDSSAIPTTLVSRVARQHVKVALSADGGDEIFGGYRRYSVLNNINNRTNKIPGLLKSISGGLLKFGSPFHQTMKGFNSIQGQKVFRIAELLQSKSPSDTLKAYLLNLSPQEITQLFIKKPKSLKTFFDNNNLSNDVDFLNQILAIEYKTYMCDDILTKVDRATMSAGLEGREPLLDQRIIEFFARVRSNQKMPNGNLKQILKQLTHKYIPSDLMERPKMGFGVPVLHWLKNDLKEITHSFLDLNRIKEENIFDVPTIKKAKEDFLNPKSKVNDTWIWHLIAFEMWHRKWM